MELQVYSLAIMSAACSFVSLGRQINKFTLIQSKLLPPYGYIPSRLNLCRACFYRTSSGNALLKNRTLIGWKSQEIFDLGRVLASSARSYCSSGNNNGDKEKAVTQESHAKKQLKSEDLFRILSLAKPEYKSLAGKQ